MLMNLYVSRLALKISIFDPTEPDVRPTVLNISPAVASVTHSVPTEQLVEKGAPNLAEDRLPPHWWHTSQAANLALWPFIDPLLRHDQLQNNKPLLERVCDQMQSVLSLVSSSLPPSSLPAAFRPSADRRPSSTAAGDKPRDSETPPAPVLDESALNMWHSLQATTTLEPAQHAQPPSAVPLNINTDLHQVNQLSSVHDHSTTNLTRKTVKRIVVRKKKVKKKKKRPKGTL